MNTKAIEIVLTATVLLTVFAKSACDCGGYRLEIEYIRNCNSDNIVELSKNFSVALKQNCQMELRGCVTLYANITDAEIDYTVQKDTFKRSGKKNVCVQLENAPDEIVKVSEKLGVPNRCPFKKGTVCLDNKSINVSKYKLRMNVLVGHLKGKALMTTNAGKSCVEFSAKLDNVFVRAFALPTIHGR
ncbi:Ganglioside GM2 activator,MD-2-related lipid-recognition domain [Cinara cedri]|uniref:Ganglioside GM2 activator,MD-2-related lipid-recognition domain n=1 Tax=Cinara cedri TaxID=506608 RepID=A0A5E4MRJ3_9HEMI|nr:Ganglioside GM2 activator,MD-2-related lipid-recognition domain [Cinara cedri]